MATLLSRELNAIKESWDETIHMISPTKVPFTTMTTEEKVTVNKPQWTEDELAAVDLNNRRFEGADAIENNGNDVQTRSTSLQHMDETVKVSDIADIVDKVGRKAELTRRLFKKVAELKRTREAIMLSGQVAVADVNNPAMDSFQSLVHADNRIATGSTAMPTEKNLLDTLQTLYVAGADPSVIMVTPDYSVALTEFSKAAGRFREIPNVGSGAGTSIVNAVELFVSPFGQQKVVINRFSRAGDTFIFDPEHFTKLAMVPWTTEARAKTGRANKVQVFGTFGLKLDNSKAAAVIRNVTGTAGKFTL